MRLSDVLVIGGSGFLGSHLSNRLGAGDVRVRVPTRRRERAKHLLPLPTVEVVEADVHDVSELTRLMAGQDAVINLVGTLQSGKASDTSSFGHNFARAHVELPRKVVAAMHAAGVSRLIQISALKASLDAPSGYLRSKAAGEAVVLGDGATGLAVTVFRPSVVFGRGDSFLTLFARLLDKAPFVPLACPDARFQPVWVQDVAECIHESLVRPEAFSQCYELCGPRLYTLRQLVEYVGVVTGRPRPVIGLSDRLSYVQAWLMEFLPGGPMTRDNYYSMQVPNICNENGECALPFDIAATPLETIVPEYLAEHGARADNYVFRRKARR